MYRGQWNPPVDEVIHKNYFKDNRKGFFIECGGGTSGESCSFFEDELGWDGIYVEASKYNFGQLSINRPFSKTLFAGLSEFTDTIPFTDVVSAPGGGHGNGSFSHTKAHKDILDSYRCSYETYDVAVFSYKDFIEKFIPDQQVDLMVLDVEGHELEVINSMFKVSPEKRPSVMCVEYPIVGLKRLENTMYSLGYFLDFVSYNNAYFHRNDFEMSSSANWFGETPVMKDI